MSDIYFRNASYFRNGNTENGNIHVKDGIIRETGSLVIPDGADVSDINGNYVVPGFIDLHTHGAVGVDVNAADEDGIVKLSRFYASHGVTGFLCSILTDSEERTLNAVENICRASRKADGAKVLGIHLEGPFLSHKYAGAMPPQLLADGNYDLVRRYFEASEGMIRTITVSPEVPGVLEIIPKLVELGIRVLIGHSDATYVQAAAAIEAGASGITHTFNAMRLFHQHEPAIMGAALEKDVYCEAICDGLHLHPATVAMLLKCKGLSRVMGITDSIMATGLPDGEYMLGINPITVKNGDAMLSSAPVRAGSTLTLDRALRNLKVFTGANLEEAVQIVGVNPAEFLGINDHAGISPGNAADICVLDQDWNVLAVYTDGSHVNTDY